MATISVLTLTGSLAFRATLGEILTRADDTEEAVVAFREALEPELPRSGAALPGEVASLTPVGFNPTLVGSTPAPVGFNPTPVGLAPTRVGLNPTPVGSTPTRVGFNPT